VRLGTSIIRKNQQVTNAVKNLQKIINDAGIGLDHAANGFYTDCSRHLGTHTYKFLIYLNRQISSVAGNRQQIIDKLTLVADNLVSGAIKF
jgi:hypothetical protein